MSGTRKNRVNDPEQPSLLDFTDITKDILYPIVAAAADDNNDYTSPAATDVMRRLSSTCKTMNTFFKPQLDYRYAKTLLAQVLQLNEKNKVGILKAAQEIPRLFFIKATAQDYAMDLEGNVRTMKEWSPYQALFGASGKDMLAAVKPYLDAYLKTLSNGDELATLQEKEKFPNGFDFPPSTDEFNRIVDDLAAAVTNDAQLKQNWNNPNSATSILLKEFREYQKPGIVEIGHHYNMNDMIRTHEIYGKFRGAWDIDQHTFWSVFIIGFQHRLITATYLAMACMGLHEHVNQNQPLVYNFELMNYVAGKKIAIVPFTSEDSSCRLGSSFVIEGCYARVGRAQRSVDERRPDAERVLGKLCQANTAKLSRLMHRPKKQGASSCLIA